MTLLIGTMTVMKLKALLYRLYKVDSTVQRLSYKDSKVCELHTYFLIVFPYYDVPIFDWQHCRISIFSVLMEIAPILLPILAHVITEAYELPKAAKKLETQFHENPNN